MTTTTQMVQWIRENDARARHAKRIVSDEFKAWRVGNVPPMQLGSKATEQVLHVLYVRAGHKIAQYVAIGASPAPETVDWLEVAMAMETEADDRLDAFILPPQGSDEGMDEYEHDDEGGE